jgi:hypothetical protein
VDTAVYNVTVNFIFKSSSIFVEQQIKTIAGHMGLIGETINVSRIWRKTTLKGALRNLERKSWITQMMGGE